MSTRSTRSRTAKGEAQTLVNDYFKTTRKGAKPRGEKKLIDEAPAVQQVKQETDPVVEKTTRTRARTPTQHAQLNTKELCGSPAKKEKIDETPVLAKPAENIVLEQKPTTTTKNALDTLMKSQEEDVKKKKKIRTVADLQARLAEKGAAKSIHEQNLKNKGKKVEEHKELLISPVKKVIVEEKKGRGRKLAAVKAVKPQTLDKLVPEYVLPNILKSAEKSREEAEEEYESEIKRRTEEFLKSSKLIEEVKESLKLDINLPTSYEHLANAFQHIDRIISIIMSQNRSCVAPELFKNVKNSLQRDFSSRHLSQILHVYPQSYHVEMREQWKAFGGVQAGKYELEVKPNLKEDLAGFIKDIAVDSRQDDIPLVRPGKLMASPMKSPRKGMATPALRIPEINGKQRLDAARMRDRAHVFRHKLIQMVRKHYDQFLISQGMKPSSKFVRLHPLFEVDKHCPPVEQMNLPEAPVKKSQHHVGMREYMEKNIEPTQIELPSIVSKAIEELKSPQKPTMVGNVPLSPRKFAEMKEEQKSKGAMSLLERIRAKEACKKAAEACVDEDLKSRKSKLTLIDTRYLRTLCSLYAAKKARSMEIDQVAEKLVFSSSVPTTKNDVISHLDLLCKVAPGYMTATTMMGKKFLQIFDNNYDAISELVKDELSKATRSTMEQARKMEEAQKMAMMGAVGGIAKRPFSPQASKAARSLKFA